VVSTITCPIFLFHAKTQRRKDANLLLLLSTHYPHQAAISTRKTRMWLICTDFWNNGYLPALFFSRKGANGLLLLSTHYPHQAVISTRITRWRLIGIMAIYLPDFLFHAKTQMGYYCLVLTTHIRQ